MRNLKQLRAISYSICQRKENERRRLIDDLSLEEEFKNSKYKTLSTFIRYNESMIRDLCKKQNINFYDYRF